MRFCETEYDKLNYPGGKHRTALMVALITARHFVHPASLFSIQVIIANGNCFE
jgi:hypothetical protein